MRNLLHFIIRYNYFFTLLVVEVIAFTFIIRNHAYQRTGFLNSANVVTGTIYYNYFKLSEYLNLGAVNEQLMNENALLRQRGYAIGEADTSGAMLDSGDVRYEFIPVKVINFTSNRTVNYITINKGKNAGIENDMGLITGSGVIGIVNRVSDNFATAMSVLHKDCNISVKVKRFNYPGTVRWEGGNPSIADVTGIPQHLQIAVGDTVVSSGFSAIFPENIPVGVISEFSLPQGSSFYSVKIKLSANLETLQYAYAVNNLYQKEQRALEMKND